VTEGKKNEKEMSGYRESKGFCLGPGPSRCALLHVRLIFDPRKLEQTKDQNKEKLERKIASRPGRQSPCPVVNVVEMPALGPASVR
jgi:hypothetical protein